jgi:DNA-directed RNA polymerase specialized sigma24 family protein
MPADPPISHWLSDLKTDDAAAQGLWENYFQRLVALARRKLPANARRVADEEDVALSAFNSFCDGVRRGRFPQLSDRDDLWRLLVVITARKAQAHARLQTRLKRGGGQVRGESVFAATDGGPEGAGMGQVAGAEPTPEFTAEVADQCRRLFGLLEDEGLRAIASLKMEGYTVDEIAAKIGRSRRSVLRRLELIRELWSADAAEGPG